MIDNRPERVGMFMVWVRIDRSTRMMRGCMMHCTLENAHAFAAQQWGSRAYEIDCDGVTVFVSVKSSAILNGNQYGLFKQPTKTGE